MSRILQRLYSSSQSIRSPPTIKAAPDLHSIRNNVEVYSDNARRRNYDHHVESPQKIASLASSIGAAEYSLRQPRTELKQLQRQLVAAKSGQSQHEGGTSGDRLLSDIDKKQKDIDQVVQRIDRETEERLRLALALPNLTSSGTPTDGAPGVLEYINYDPNQPLTNFESVADHSVIGEKLSLLDFTSASETSGWGFYYLKNEAALLEQALVQYALAVAMQYGWKVVSPPSLVYSHIADACGFQPRDQNDEQQIWQIAQAEKHADKLPRSLAATAEIPFAGLYAKKAIKEEELPIKIIGSSRCYRAEAGARGVDTKGLYRVHEFTKVEMFAWTDAPSMQDVQLPGSHNNIDEVKWTGRSTKVFDEMVQIQKHILGSLGLPCQVLEMPYSDLGASAFRKIDIEALFPSRLDRNGGWGEVTSASNCTDYQSRRLDTKIVRRDGSSKIYPHTVNGTAVAVPRVLAAILEHGWRSNEGCVVIPEVLRPYMGGMDRIVSK